MDKLVEALEKEIINLQRHRLAVNEEALEKNDSMYGIVIRRALELQEHSYKRLLKDIKDG